VTLLGAVWLAVLVSQGIRSNTAALVAGLTFTMVQYAASQYIHFSWSSQLPYILFGLGAIGVVRNPNGVLSDQLRRVTALVASR
jgi:branched-chain amino acid transport system permease protein